MTDAPLLEVDDLNIWFRLANRSVVHAVKGVSFSLATNQRLGLVGESGSGKSTIGFACLGLLPSNAIASGSIRLNGVDLLALKERDARGHRWTDVAMVFQSAMNSFNPVLTIGNQIVEAIRRGSDGSGSTEATRVTELLEQVGLRRNLAARYPHELSGGMRQRAAIAMALACSPRVLFADEPTTALDVMIEAQILELLVALAEAHSISVVLVTHDMSVITRVCNEACVLLDGKLVETGPVEQLYHAPAHPYTAALFRAAVPPLIEKLLQKQAV